MAYTSSYTTTKGKLRYRAHWSTGAGKPPGSKRGWLKQTDAYNYAVKQEAEARAGKVGDPARGEITLADWALRWFGSQGALEENTLTSYKRHLELRILPALGDTTLNDLTAKTIQDWANTRPGNCGRSTMMAARSVLRCMLNDAVDDKRIDENPVKIESGRRGNIAARRMAQRARIQPHDDLPSFLQSFLIAERATVLTDDPEHFVRIIALAGAGIRWGESNALETGSLVDGGIAVDWQVKPRRRRWPPKDGSVRVVHVPEFVSGVLADHASKIGDRRCRCGPDATGCGSPAGEYLFLTQARHHRWAGMWIAKVLQPAASGVINYPDEREPAPVLLNMTGPWPGARIRRPLPFAVPGEPYALQRHHPKFREESALANWLPIVPHVYPHLFRHAYNTILFDLGVPRLLRKAQLGHNDPLLLPQSGDVQDRYTHITPQAQAKMIDGVQGLWVEAVRDRIRLFGQDSASPFVASILKGALD